MKRNVLFGSIALLAGSLIAADSTPKEDVIAAAKKLAEKANYSWKLTLDLGPNSQFTPGPTEGKTEKDGYTWLSVSFNDNTTIGLKKGSKVAIKTDEGWQSGEEAGAGGEGFNAGRFMAMRMQNLKVPAAEVEDLVSKAKAIKKDGEAYSGDLTEEGAKTLLASGFGRRGGAPPTNTKGSVKFWVKDGMLTKYESKLSGKREINGEERDIQRTTTVEIKNIGATKIDAPEEAKKKLS